MTGDEHGPQPLDAWMISRELDNKTLHAHAPEGLNQKMIRKARSGRELTSKSRAKILLAAQTWMKKQDAEAETKEDYPRRFTDLFSY